MKSQVHNLQNLSDETVRGLLESLQLQEVLEQQQKQILDNQERMLQQGQEVCSLTCIPVLPTVRRHTHLDCAIASCLSPACKTTMSYTSTKSAANLHV